MAMLDIEFRNSLLRARSTLGVLFDYENGERCANRDRRLSRLVRRRVVGAR